MPCDLTLYGPDWPQFSRSIRYVRARGQCECTGQCGLHTSAHERYRCKERHHTKALYAKGTVRLTVAHLCDCDPPCQDPNHVIAACQRCHLRIDRWRHARHRLAARTATATARVAHEAPQSPSPCCPLSGSPP